MYEIIIKFMADWLILVVVLVGAWALIFKVNQPRFQAYGRIIMAGLTAVLLAKLIATLYQPEVERPFELLGQAAGAAYLNNPGFPSDHTLFCMTITLAVWFETRLRKVAILLGVLTLLVAIGRVLALVHTPLDVIGGIVIALSGIVWYLQTSKNEMTADTRQIR